MANVEDVQPEQMVYFPGGWDDPIHVTATFFEGQTVTLTGHRAANGESVSVTLPCSTVIGKPPESSYVHYHGSLIDQHGEYIFVGPCVCIDCDFGPTRRYVLCNRRNIELLHVRASSFTPSRPDCQHCNRKSPHAPTTALTRQTS